MTKTQVNFILGKLGVTAETTLDVQNVKNATVLNGIKAVIINKQEMLYTDRNLFRFIFDSTDELLMRVPVKVFSSGIYGLEANASLPNTPYYDIVSDQTTNRYYVYEYYHDDNGLIGDIFAYNAIHAFKNEPGVQFYD